MIFNDAQVDEFFDGICKIVSSQTPIEQLRLLKQIAINRVAINEVPAAEVVIDS